MEQLEADWTKKLGLAIFASSPWRFAVSPKAGWHNQYNLRDGGGVRPSRAYTSGDQPRQ